MKFCFTEKEFVELDISSEKTAIVGEDISLTWAEFRDKVNELVLFFESNGFDKINGPVVVYGHKSANMLVAFYALMKMQINYIPIDESYPTERIKTIISEANCELIIKTSAREGINSISEIELVNDSISLEKKGEITQREEVSGDPIIYTIFTSGSTGKPKGVQISTEAVQSFARWMTGKDFGFTANEVFINTAILSFDLSVFEVMTFSALGGSIILNGKESVSDPEILLDRIEKHKGSVWVSTPSFALKYERMEKAPELDSISMFLFCGEILPNALAKGLLEKYNGKVINTYGPTEATVATTFVNITQEIIAAFDPLPVGISKQESELTIENEEIIIAGPNVSLGYLNNESLNNEKFFIRNGTRAFRTGDKGYLEKGMLFFKGRNDDLIKLHGYRIELNEITTVLNSLDYILQGEAIALKRNEVAKKIVSLVVLKSEVTKEKIKEDLALIIPSYMIPSDIKFVEQIPLTANGKTDKNKLVELYKSK
ncbi:MAG: AMP-binding protein [Flavobacteriales bacterium]